MSQSNPSSPSRDNYSQAELQSLATLFDSLAAEATDLSDLLQRWAVVRADADTLSQTSFAMAACERAFAYDFDRDATPFGALELGQRLSSERGDWPPAFDKVADTERRVWLECSGLVEHPLPRGRFRDLALAVGLANGRDAALQVVSDYLELGQDNAVDAYFRAACLRRANHLARQFGLGEEGQTRRLLYALGTNLISSLSSSPGAVFMAIEPLAVNPRTGPFDDPTRDEVGGLVDRVAHAFRADSFAFEAIHDVRIELASTVAERTVAHESLVRGYMGLAEATSGLVRQRWLSDAADQAQRFGLSALRGSAISALQAMSVDELELKAFTFEKTIPRYVADARIPLFRHANSLFDAVALWLQTPAPTGDDARNREAAAENSNGSIRSLITRVVLGERGLPKKTRVGSDGFDDEERERLELFAVAIRSRSLATELAAIYNHFGHPDAADLSAQVSTNYGCDQVLTASYVKALEYFWSGDYPAAARASFPLVEACARGSLLVAGEPLYVLEAGSGEGRFPSLETYAQKLEEVGFEASWLRTLRNPVASLRNSLAHGHKLEPDSDDAALLLRMAGLLLLVTPPDSSKLDRQEVAQRLRDPLAWARNNAPPRRRRKWARRATRDEVPRSSPE